MLYLYNNVVLLIFPGSNFITTQKDENKKGKCSMNNFNSFDSWSLSNQLYNQCH